MSNITQKLGNAEPDQLFGRGLRKVIRHFLTHPKEEIYQLALALKIQSDVAPLQYHLRRLSEIGFLLSRPTRYRHYYRLNQHWPYLAALRKLFPAKL